jgi:hypothetical protein
MGYTNFFPIDYIFDIVAGQYALVFYILEMETYIYNSHSMWDPGRIAPSTYVLKLFYSLTFFLIHQNIRQGALYTLRCWYSVGIIGLQHYEQFDVGRDRKYKNDGCVGIC